MDFEEALTESSNKKSSETGQTVDIKPVRSKFSKTVIGEDLRRAIVALRSVPKVNWSQDPSCDDEGHASTEYIWRAIDLSGNSSSFGADWQAAVKLNDCSQEMFLTNNAAQKMVGGQAQNQSEIMRRDSFTVSSKRLDRTSDSKCQLVEQRTTAVQMALFSPEKRGKENDNGRRCSISSTPGEQAVSPTGAAVTRKPPPLPPKPAHLHNFNVKQHVTGKLSMDGKHISRGAKDWRKADVSPSRVDLDAADIYERSLDVLEKDDSDQDFEDLSSPRSDSPERLLEELLDSVPAEEFDSLECHATTNVSITNGVTVQTDMLSVGNLGPKSNGADKRQVEEVQEKQKRDQELKVKLTRSDKTESSSRTDPFSHQQNKNLPVKPFHMLTKPVTIHLDFNAVKKGRSPPSEGSFSSTVTSDKELTPEDIFEEIMDFLETRKEDRGRRSDQLPSSSGNNRNQKQPEHESKQPQHVSKQPQHVSKQPQHESKQPQHESKQPQHESKQPQHESKQPHHESSNLSACDYLLENEWLSIYCDQIEAETQNELKTKSIKSERISDAIANTKPTNSGPSTSATKKAVFERKQIAVPPPGSTATFPSPDREVLQGPNSTLLPQDGKDLQSSNKRLTSPNGNALRGPNTRLLSPGGNVLPGPYTTPLSPDGKVNVTSQDTLQATVTRKPVPPLKETVQTFTFTKRDSLMQDIKIAPTIKVQPLTQTKEPKIVSNGFSVSSNMGLNSRISDAIANTKPTNSGPSTLATKKAVFERYKPATAIYENSEKRRVAYVLSSADSNAVPLREIKRTNIHTGEKLSTTESSLPRDENKLISQPTNRIVAIITRESDLSGCDTCDEEMDLDLETELSRNLDACTSSDVECQSIDKLVTSESLFSSSDTKDIRRPKKSTSLDVKVPRKLGEIFAKKKLKKSQSIDKTAEVVWPQEGETLISRQVHDQQNTKIPTLGKSLDTTKEASHNLSVRAAPEFSDKLSKRLNNCETTEKISPGCSTDSEPVKYETPPLEESSIKEGTETTVSADSSGSDNEDSYKQTMIRNVRSAEKENTKELEKRKSIEVLSEEVTSQEIVLKIAWPKQDLKGRGRITETRKPPFRELQLKRVLRISDLDNPLNIFPNVDNSQSPLAVTQQSHNALRPGLTPLPTSQPNNRRGIISPAAIKSSDDHSVATRKNSEITVEYIKQTNCRKLENISDSAIDVQKRNTVKVLRVPMAAVHKVEDIKDAVAAVGSTILSDLQRQPKKRNIRVTCEAVESKSRASLHDQDVTVIRNTIVDTYGPKPAIVFSSAPANSVQT